MTNQRMDITRAWFLNQFTNERIMVEIAAQSVSLINVATDTPSMSVPWVRIEKPDPVEEELANDKRLYGNCFWRFDGAGNKIRIDPMTVMCVQTANTGYRYIVKNHNWVISGESR